MGIEAFVVNTALSIGAKLVGAWLSPKKQPEKTIPEDIPQLGQGNPVYGIWGLSFSPGSLLYVTPASLAGHGNDRSTYGILGFSNPDSTAGLIALRINNQIAASRSSIFPIISENATDVRLIEIVGAAVYGPSNDPSLNIYPDGLRVKSDLSLIYQMGTNTPNPNFSINGYAGLQYEGLTWVGLQASSRAVYGGVNARFVMYAKNRVTAGGPIPFTIKADTPVSITTFLGFDNGKDFYKTSFPLTFPRGFFGVKKILCFDSTHVWAVMGVSGESEYIIHSYRDNNLTYVKFSLTSSVAPGRPIALPGSFPLMVYSFYVPAMTDKLILGEIGGRLTEVTLPAPAMPPFKSTNGVITDVFNNVVLTTTSNFRCYGWAGTLFVFAAGDLILTDSLDPSVIELPSADFTGTSESAKTLLSTIIGDLVENKRPGATIIDISTPDEVSGFTSDYDSIDSTLIELCTAYAKIIFEDGDGDYWLTDYPEPTPVATFTSKDFLEKPVIELSPEYNQPSQIELTYRSFNDQLSEKVIHVGYGNRFGSTANVKYNLCLEESEARRIAWNILFLRSHTNVKLSFRSERFLPRAGLVIEYNDELYLVGDMEIGQDMTVRYTCVNYVPVNDPYPEYMLGNTSLATIPGGTAEPIRPFTVPTETRQLTGYPDRYGSFYTNSSALVNVRRNDGNLLSLRLFSPTTGGFTGQVTSFTLNTGDIVHGYEEVTIMRTRGNAYLLPVSQVIRIGQSWVRFGSVNQSGDEFILSDLSVGQFGSLPIISGGDYVADLSSINELLGWVPGGALSLADQDGFSSFMKSVPGFINSSPTPLGTVTPQYPHGFPVAGISPAQVVGSSYGGVLRVWLSKPGNQNNGFFLNNRLGGVDSGQTRWFIQSGVGFLFSFISLDYTYYTTDSAAIPQGQAVMYLANQGHTIGSPILMDTGSYTFPIPSF